MRERCFKKAGKNRTDRSACDGHKQPRKTETENTPRRYIMNLREMKPERFEEVIVCAFALALVAFEDAVREDIGVHNSNHATLRIDDRKREELVEHEKLARFQNGRVYRQSNYANQALAFIDRVKINDAFTHPFAPDCFQCFSDTGIRFEQRKIFARVIQRRRVKIDRAGNFHGSAVRTLCTIPLSRKILAASLK